MEGSLGSLEAAYMASLHRIRADGTVHDQPGPPICHRRIYASTGTQPFCAFTLQSPDEEVAVFRPQQIKMLVAMIRHAAECESVRNAVHRRNASASANDLIDIDQVVLGHPHKASGLRLSILPLPSIGHPHSDGQIRRVILVESGGGNGTLCRLLSDSLSGLVLEPEAPDAVTSPVCLVSLDPANRFLRYYTGASRIWASVTPVLLPGFDDRKYHRGNHEKRLARAEQLVCKALAQAGIDSSASIEISRVPFWAGTMNARDYEPRAKLAHYPRWHVRLAFDRPWTGPLAIGAGRHSGLGVFAAQEL
jgi:CRISPR-associated protein Csb2